VTVRGQELVLPPIGFGTFALRGAAGVAAIRSALHSGYRLLDSAFSYENEGAVGRAVRTAGIPREDILVTSKLPGRHHESPAAIRTIEESLFRSGLDYLDLYLIHWPNPRRDHYVAAWSALIEARERGLVRAIGVSNFQPEHIERLRAETGVLPAVNQIELHPYFPQAELREYHEANGIVTQAWTPIGHRADLLSDPAIGRIADAHGVRPAQAILRWHLRLGVVPLPKATTPEHQRQNLDLFGFTLTDAEMSTIAGLGRPDGRTNGQDPRIYEEL
jgi:diketogulonate reductase-like aldo/keto reductase